MSHKLYNFKYKLYLYYWWPTSRHLDFQYSKYLRRLDSAEVRERRTVHGLSETAPSAGDCKDRHDFGEHPPPADQNSATESTEEYDVPLEVNQRISEWFTRNEAAASRQSEATDTNLEDIRQKAKDRIKERNNPPLANSKVRGKIINSISVESHIRSDIAGAKN